MSAVTEAQFGILQSWARGLGWWMVGKSIAANALDLKMADEGLTATTPVPELQPWIEFAALAEAIQC